MRVRMPNLALHVMRPSMARNGRSLRGMSGASRTITSGRFCSSAHADERALPMAGSCRVKKELRGSNLARWGHSACGQFSAIAAILSRVSAIASRVPLAFFSAMAGIFIIRFTNIGMVKIS